jgi:hypothetical protein
VHVVDWSQAPFLLIVALATLAYVVSGIVLLVETFNLLWRSLVRLLGGTKSLSNRFSSERQDNY